MITTETHPHENLLLILLACVCLGCDRYNVPDFLEIDRTLNYTFDCPSVRVDTVLTFRDGLQLERHQYTYDAQDRIVKILNATYGDETVIEYGPNNKPSKKETYSVTVGRRELSRRSIYSYDSLDRLWELDLGNFYYRYLYDSLGRVDKLLFGSHGPNPSSVVLAKYIWGPEHIERVEYPYEDTTRGIRYEYAFTYDTQCNPFSNQTFNFENVFSNENNVISSVATDHEGLLDASCYDCQYQYEYNARGFPTKVTSNYGIEIRYTYQ